MPKKFLLIDDDIDDRELFSEAVAAVDATAVCYCAPDAEEGLNELYKKKIDTPDIIFLDINMPVMSGWQCLTELKKSEQYKNIPVVMYSTSSHKRDKDISKDLGAQYFITKPNGFKDLKGIIKVILTHLNQGNPISSAFNQLDMMLNP